MNTMPIELTEAEAQRLAILAKRDAGNAAGYVLRMRAHGEDWSKISDAAVEAEVKRAFAEKLADFAFNFPVVDRPTCVPR